MTVVTGANGSGKTSLYRAPRLLAGTTQGRLVATLAAEGGLTSTLRAGLETVGRSVRAGVHPVQGTARQASISLKLGFAGDRFGYALDLGMPPKDHPFPLDPAIKVETLWMGERPSRTTILAERRLAVVRLRSARRANGGPRCQRCCPSTPW